MKKLSTLLKEYKDKLSPLKYYSEDYNVDKIKLIGITGTVGKTSVAYMLHEYLKYAGFTSILYSSLKIDSPASFKNNEEVFEGSVTTELEVVDIINEAKAINAEYVVIEVSEEALRLGAFDNIHFDIRCLTKFYNGWWKEISDEDYFKNKLSLFNKDEKSTCIINLSSHKFEEFYNNSLGKKVVINTGISGNYLELYNRRFKDLIPLEDIKYYCSWGFGGIDNSYMKMKCDDIELDIHTSLATNYSLNNIITTVSILNELNVLDKDLFEEFISDPDLEIEGRSQDIQIKGRTIIIDYDHFNIYGVFRDYKDDAKEIEEFKEKYFKEFNKEFNTQEIKRVIGVSSTEASSNSYSREWAKNNPQHKYYGLDVDPQETRSYDTFSKLVNGVCDKTYLTTINPANRHPIDIVKELSGVITIPKVLCPYRKDAIKRAILESEVGDVILIPGRGNRKIWMTSDDNFELWADIDIVKEAIKGLR